MPIRYTTKDIAALADFPRKNMDWLAFSWDLRNRTDPSEHRLFQAVVVPGAVFIRNGPYTRQAWRKRTASLPDNTQICRNPGDYDSLVDYAIAHTEVLLSSGYEWSVKPFAFEMDPLDYPHWPKSHRPIAKTPYVVGRGPKPTQVKTLGDAVATGNGRVYADVMSKSFVERTRKR